MGHFLSAQEKSHTHPEALMPKSHVPSALPLPDTGASLSPASLCLHRLFPRCQPGGGAQSGSGSSASCLTCHVLHYLDINVCSTPQQQCHQLQVPLQGTDVQTGEAWEEDTAEAALGTTHIIRNPKSQTEALFS